MTQHSSALSETWRERFGGLSRLYGETAAERLASAHVQVIGLGGVGSWVVEALARSGIGALTLVDLDDVCLSNINRQLPALGSTVGQLKVDVLARRVRDIHPELKLEARPLFFTETSAGKLLEARPDVVIDAIDTVRNKVRLLVECRKRKQPVVTCGGAGGRIDPTQVRVDDLTKTRDDPLLQQTRRRLRRDFGFPEKGAFGIPCVWSNEPVRFPQADGRFSYEKAPEADYRLNCDFGFGSATFVTGTFGFAMAARAIDMVLAGETA